MILLLSIIGAISVKLLQRIDRSFFVHLHVNGRASQKHCLLLEAMAGPLLVKWAVHEPMMELGFSCFRLQGRLRYDVGFHAFTAAG